MADSKKLDSYLESDLHVTYNIYGFAFKLVVYGNDDHCCIKHLPTNDSMLLECSWLLLRTRMREQGLYDWGWCSFLPARASEQGNVIGSVRIYIYVYKKNLYLSELGI